MKHSREIYAQETGFSERNDCSIRAYSVAAGTSYEAAHDLFKKHGRRDKRSTKLATTCAVIQESFPQAQRSIFGRKGPTLNQFAAAEPKGHFIVHVHGHALALVDGVVHDWNSHPRKRVKMAWRIA